MTHRVAFLLGLFAVPAFLLWAGHHWRYRSATVRGAFWGGLVAHTVAALLATVAGLYRPAEWAPTDTWRGFFGLWSMLVLFAIGAAIGAVMGARKSDPSARPKRVDRRSGAAAGATRAVDGDS